MDGGYRHIGLLALIWSAFACAKDPVRTPPKLPVAPVGSSLFAVSVVSPQDRFYRDYLAQQDPEIWALYFGAQPVLGSNVPGKEWGYDRVRAEGVGREDLAKQIFRRRLDQALTSYLVARGGSSREFVKSVNRMKNVPISNTTSSSSRIEVQMGFDLFADVTHLQFRRQDFSAEVVKVGILGALTSSAPIEQGMGVRLRLTLNSRNTAAFAHYAIDSKSVETGVVHPLPHNWHTQLTYRQGLENSASSYEVLFVHRF